MPISFQTGQGAQQIIFPKEREKERDLGIFCCSLADHLLSNESEEKCMRPCKWCRKCMNSGPFPASILDVSSSGQFALSALVEDRNNNIGLCKPRNTAVVLSSPIDSVHENQLAGSQLALKSCIVSGADRHMGQGENVR